MIYENPKHKEFAESNDKFRVEINVGRREWKPMRTTAGRIYEWDNYEDARAAMNMNYRYLVENIDVRIVGIDAK